MPIAHALDVLWVHPQSAEGPVPKGRWGLQKPEIRSRTRDKSPGLRGNRDRRLLAVLPFEED
jgi:hypothetical protein